MNEMNAKDALRIFQIAEEKGCPSYRFFQDVTAKLAELSALFPDEAREANRRIELAFRLAIRALKKETEAQPDAFDWEKFREGKIGVHCPDDEKRRDFLYAVKEHLPEIIRDALENGRWLFRVNRGDVTGYRIEPGECPKLALYSVTDSTLPYCEYKGE